MKDKYKIITTLDETAFNKSYLVKSDKDNKKYVIQHIVLDIRTNEEIRYVLNEVAPFQNLDHQNIIKIKEVFIQRKPKEALNIVIEFDDFEYLNQKIEKKQKEKNPFPEPEILDYIFQICLALKYLHEKK